MTKRREEQRVEKYWRDHPSPDADPECARCGRRTRLEEEFAKTLLQLDFATRALTYVKTFVAREIADDPTQGDPGTEIGALCVIVDEALAGDAAPLPKKKSTE
jgi:hypothetical protein